MKSSFILSILLSSLFLSDVSDLKRAKQLMSRQMYEEAIVVLNQVDDYRSDYYVGFCYFKLDDCNNSSLYLHQFLQSEESINSEWQLEATSILQNCGNSSQRTIQNPPTSNLKQVIQAKANFRATYQDFVNASNVENLENNKVLEEEELEFYSGEVIIKNTNPASIDGIPINSTNDKQLNTNGPPPALDDVEDDMISQSSGIDQAAPQLQVVTPNDNSSMTENISSKTGDNPPMTENISSKTGDNPPMTENVVVNEDEPHVDQLIVTNKDHHYKIMFTITNNPDEIFLSLMDLGPVSSEEASPGNYIYYIGHYDTKDEASAQVPQVKAKGFQLARVMEFDGGAFEEEYLEVETVSVTKQIKSRKQKTKKPKKEKIKLQAEPKEQIKEVVKQEKITYYILFRVLDNPYETFPDLEDVGELYRETFDAEGNSRYLLGTAVDVETARTLLEVVKSRGYKASFIAEYKNGALANIIQ